MSIVVRFRKVWRFINGPVWSTKFSQRATRWCSWTGEMLDNGWMRWTIDTNGNISGNTLWRIHQTDQKYGEGYTRWGFGQSFTEFNNRA